MRVKEYLGQAYKLDQNISAKLKLIELLNELATKSTNDITDMPRKPNCNASLMADTVAKIVDLKAEVNKDIDRLVDLKREITGVIKTVEDMEYRKLLELRYISFKTWKGIAIDLNKPESTVKGRMHSNALQKLQNVEKVLDVKRCIL